MNSLHIVTAAAAGYIGGRMGAKSATAAPKRTVVGPVELAVLIPLKAVACLSEKIEEASAKEPTFFAPTDGPCRKAIKVVLLAFSVFMFSVLGYVILVNS